MNILMLNPVHPGTPHISAVRAWRFAQELAALGHHVVLLTATDATRTINLSPDAHHDWRQPAVLPCADATSSSDQKPSHRIPRAMHRARTALRMLSHGGASTQWVRAAVDAGTHLPSDCAPDVVWATFGRMEALFAARHIAGRLHIPWVLDIKDNWELYTPRGLRQIMVWRTRGFAAATANAMFTQQLARKWQRAEASLVYSGVEDFFFVPTSTPPSEHFEINLIGAIYFPDLLHTFLGGIATWYDALSPPQRRQVRLRHIGSHGELVRATAQRLLPALSIDVPGYVPTTQMAQLCQRANINAYISHPAGFHHKLLELLACGRPVLAFPSENHESVALAAQVKGQLIVPSTPAALTSALNDLSTPFFGHNEPVRNLPGTNASRYSWRAQARLLQDVLATVAPPK